MWVSGVSAALTQSLSPSTRAKWMSGLTTELVIVMEFLELRQKCVEYCCACQGWSKVSPLMYPGSYNAALFWVLLSIIMSLS